MGFSVGGWLEYLSAWGRCWGPQSLFCSLEVRIAFYPIWFQVENLLACFFIPFFPSVSVQKVCPCLTWQGKEQLDDPWLVRRHLQDADHTNRDRGQTQGPGSACLDAVLMMLVVALKPCFLLFLCCFNLFFLLGCTVRKEKLWTLPPPALNLHSSVMLIKTCTILLWSNWILNKGWQDYINCKAWRFSEFRV